MDRLDVAVIGAGVSGLTAADRLQRAGASVACLEARERIGGRALSRDGWVDLGATWFWENETAVVELAERLLIRSYPQWIDGDALFEQAPGAIARLRGNPLDVPCRRLEGGVQVLAQRLAEQLTEGVVRIGVAVQTIEIDEDGVTLTTAGGDTLLARVAILALPPALAVASLDITPPLDTAITHTAAATPTWMGDVIKAAARFPEPFWRTEGLAGSAISYVGPFAEFHDHGGAAAGQTALFGFAPASAFAGRDDAQIIEAFTDQLVRLWGERAAAPIAVDLVDWSRERYTVPPDPMAGVDVRGHVSLAVPHQDGRLLFASTETSGSFAGHLEGAIRAGRRAGEHALERLGGGRR